MADRYQDRQFPAHDDYGRGTDQHGQKAESDPLAELARLIGQTDPFAMGRANVKAQPQAPQRYQTQQYQPREEYQPEPQQPKYDDEDDYQPSPVHPLHRYSAQQPAPPQQYAHQQYQQQYEE